jgi:hypothetical protein
MKYGYARVSTDDQSPALQLAALKKAGCKIPVFKDEGISGATVKRPALQRCLKQLQAGDTLIVWKLDRLGRSLRDLITMLDDLKQLDACAGSFAYHAALKLGQYANHLPHSAACGRLGVDVFCKGAEFHAAL